MTDKKFFVWEALDKYRDNIFYLNENEAHSYQEFKDDIRAMMANLQPFAVVKDERVAVVASASYQTLSLYLAFIALRAIPVLIPENFPKGKLKELLATISCQKIISEEIISSSDSPDTYSTFPEVSLADTASIMFTSGTSALPKAVAHTFGNHFYSAAGSNMNINLAPEDRWLLALPIHHIGGFSIIFRTLLAGSTVVAYDTSVELYDFVEKMKISHLSLVESQVQKLVVNRKRAPDTLKAILVGGSRISDMTIDKAIALKYPIYTTYGLTEMSSQVTTTPPEASVEKLSTSGQLLPHCELKIAPDNEILVKGKTLCSGYLNSGFPVDSHGWFRTADIGSIDKDGYLTVLGRKDNMFVSGGENIYPEEIENLVKEIPAINEAVVIPQDDLRFGQVPVLFYSADIDTDISVKMVTDCLINKIEKFKIPKAVFRFPENYTPLGIKSNRRFLTDYLSNR